MPVLIIGFNRPLLTRILIESLEDIKPQKIFFAVDGPRSNFPQDKILVDAVKKLVTCIKWPCEIYTNFSKNNFGSGEWPVLAITWAFKSVDKLLILEDDVRITKNFYDLSADSLIRFNNNSEIFAICASNISDYKGSETSVSITSSKYFSGWGWATWADRWVEYKFDILQGDSLSFFTLLKKNNLNFIISLYFWYNFYQIKNNQLKAWDYQINFLLFTTQRIILKPDRNLSMNVGTGLDATHTKKLPSLILNVLPFPKKSFNYQLGVDSRKEKLWRKSRLRFLIKSTILRIYHK